MFHFKNLILETIYNLVYNKVNLSKNIYDELIKLLKIVEEYNFIENIGLIITIFAIASRNDSNNFLEY